MLHIYLTITNDSIKMIITTCYYQNYDVGSNAKGVSSNANRVC